MSQGSYPGWLSRRESIDTEEKSKKHIKQGLQCRLVYQCTITWPRPGYRLGSDASTPACRSTTTPPRFRRYYPNRAFALTPCAI